jgi:hypothetical protein
MRYPKGSIQLNQSRDLPLLRQILHSEFITRSQLFEFMELNGYERSRNSYDWRMRRLVERGLVMRQTALAGTGDFVYSLAADAAELLQTMGEYCLIGRGRCSAKNVNQGVLHAVGLNDIHLSLMRSGLLLRWTSTMQIRSQNELTDYGFAKDYDAVVAVRTEIGEYRFALEYERTPKAMKYYNAIACRVGEEAHLSRVLYLVTNYDLLRFVSGFFRKSQCAVFFGLVGDWHSQLLEMPVSNASSKHLIPFREALDGAAKRPAAGPLNYRLPFD